MPYCFVSLPKTGLANRLFPWARCKLFSLHSGARMLAPRWFQLKVGPLLRGETDLRNYSGMFRAAPEEISGFERVWTLATCPQVEEAGADSRGSRSLVRFEGVGEYFRSLNRYNGVLNRELERPCGPNGSTRPRKPGCARRHSRTVGGLSNGAIGNGPDPARWHPHAYVVVDRHAPLGAAASRR
jgi:hypothetical protein